MSISTKAIMSTAKRSDIRLKCTEKCVTVVVGKKNSMLFIAASQHVIVCTFVFDSQGPCHERIIVDVWVKVKYNQ